MAKRATTKAKTKHPYVGKFLMGSIDDAGDVIMESYERFDTPTDVLAQASKDADAIEEVQEIVVLQVMSVSRVYMKSEVVIEDVEV